MSKRIEFPYSYRFDSGEWRDTLIVFYHSLPNTAWALVQRIAADLWDDIGQGIWEEEEFAKVRFEMQGETLEYSVFPEKEITFECKRVFKEDDDA